MSTILLNNFPTKIGIKDINKTEKTSKNTGLNIEIFTENRTEENTLSIVTEKWEKKYPWRSVRVKQKGNKFEIQISPKLLTTEEHNLRAKSEASFYPRDCFVAP